MALKSDYPTQECSIARALEVVGERWTLLIVRDCFLGVWRFTDLQRHLGIPKAVLATRLERLCEAGVAERHEYRPGRHEYRLTARGLDLWPTLHSLNAWGGEHLAPHGPRSLFAHARCGETLQAGGFCARCRCVPPAADVEYRPGPARVPHEDDDPVERALLHEHRLLEPLLT